MADTKNKKITVKKVVVKREVKSVEKKAEVHKDAKAGPVGKVMDNKVMKKTIRKPLKGVVMSSKMQNTVVVAIERKVAHKLYGKLIKVTRRLKADTNGIKVKEGDVVTIEQTRPISKDKNFKVIKIEEVKK